jgi:hypothetical protein
LRYRKLAVSRISLQAHVWMCYEPAPKVTRESAKTMVEIATDLGLRVGECEC